MHSNLESFADAWVDTKDHHQKVFEAFHRSVMGSDVLLNHRMHIIQNSLGFGDTSFHWLWKLIVDQMPKAGRFLEIGVYKGQVLSLFPYLAMHLHQNHCHAVGVSMFDGRNLYAEGGKWTNPDGLDYRVDVMKLFNHFHLPAPTLIVGDSTHAATAYEASKHGPYDCVYVDGSHESIDVHMDLLNYTDHVKVGGILACDDSACGLDLPTWMFCGFAGCSAKINELLPPKGPVEFNGMTWRHLGNVMHLRIWRRIS